MAKPNKKWEPSVLERFEQAQKAKKELFRPAKKLPKIKVPKKAREAVFEFTPGGVYKLGVDPNYFEQVWGRGVNEYLGPSEPIEQDYPDNPDPVDEWTKDWIKKNG